MCENILNSSTIVSKIDKRRGSRRSFANCCPTSSEEDTDSFVSPLWDLLAYRRHKNIYETESNITHLTRFIPKRVTDHTISGHPSTCGLKVIYDLKPAECPGEKERDGHHCHPKVQDSWINLDQPV